jgi:hypothetical protein
MSGNCISAASPRICEALQRLVRADGIAVAALIRQAILELLRRRLPRELESVADFRSEGPLTGPRLATVPQILWYQFGTESVPIA